MTFQRSESARPELLKKLNQELIIRQIVKAKEISRAEISRLTGLALPSVMRLVEDLMRKGVIIESRSGDSTGGRKPNMIALNSAYKWIIGVESTSKVIVTLADFSGDVIDSALFSIGDAEVPENVLNKIAEIVNEIITKHKIDRSKIAAIGVGTPGHDFKHQGLIKGFIAKGWETIDVSEYLRQHLNIPIIVENVCRTRTLSEIWFGVGRETSDFLYAFIDWGVGVGIVKNGYLEEGSSGVAGEFGHTSIDRNGKTCYCGKKGCIEMYASVGALVTTIEAKAVVKLDENDTFDWMVAHKDHPEISKQIIEMAHSLSFALANVVNLLNPSKVVLGGVLPRLLPEITEQVKTEIGEFIFHNHAISTPIIRSAVNNETQCLGSIALVIHHELMSR